EKPTISPNGRTREESNSIFTEKNATNHSQNWHLEDKEGALETKQKILIPAPSTELEHEELDIEQFGSRTKAEGGTFSYEGNSKFILDIDGWQNLIRDD